ncbi:MAG: hypothetical protein LBQ60_10335 [Bacteroidales bacterium]|jgi:hypothetical protein|nr:hypothetical protein [Bacteroidales bacterium]
MRIAIFLDNIHFKTLEDEVKQIFLFDVEENVVKSVGEELLYIYNINYLLLWLLGKKVSIMYIEIIEVRLKDFIEKAGITVKALDEIKNNPLLASFLL